MNESLDDLITAARAAAKAARLRLATVPYQPELTEFQQLELNAMASLTRESLATLANDYASEPDKMEAARMLILCGNQFTNLVDRTDPSRSSTT